MSIFYNCLVNEINNTPKDMKLMINGDFNSKDSRIFPTKSPNVAGKMLHAVLNGTPVGPDKLIPRFPLKLLIDHPTRVREVNLKNKTIITSNLLDVVIVKNSQENLLQILIIKIVTIVNRVV